MLLFSLKYLSSQLQLHINGDFIALSPLLAFPPSRRSPPDVPSALCMLSLGRLAPQRALVSHLASSLRSPAAIFMTLLLMHRSISLQ